jgi:hypothetical protein
LTEEDRFERRGVIIVFVDMILKTISDPQLIHKKKINQKAIDFAQLKNLISRESGKHSP